jgi:SRSO17 transposase
VHAATDWASAAIDWQLFMPTSWDDTTITDALTVGEIKRRRARCKIPDQVRHREKWRLALDMLDRILAEERDGGWGLPERTVVADAGYGDATEFRLGLAERGLRYVVAVKATTSAYPADAAPSAPPYSGRGRPPTPRYRDDPTNLALPGRPR